MSTSSIDNFVDDQDSVYVDVPPAPQWLWVLDFFLSTALVLAAAGLAKHLGCGIAASVAVAVIAMGLFGFKVSYFFHVRRTPVLSPSEFDEVRRAGDLALRAFRNEYPEDHKIGWSRACPLLTGR